MTSFVISPLPAGDVDTEAPVARRTVSDGRAPCRRCLRDAGAGEALVLASYDPFTVRSPYAGEGPVFVHADSCEQFADRVADLLDDDDVEFLHVHFAGPGCFAFRVDRA